MKILLTSIGTRGDIEPFLAVGALLEKNGHTIVYSFPKQFATIVPETAVFHPLSPKVIELIESKEGQIVMGKASLWKKAKALFRLYREGKIINNELIEEQFQTVNKENPDLIIHNQKCSYPPLWALTNNKRTILLSPVPFFIHYVQGHAHLGFNRNLGSFLNKMTYRLSNFGLAKTVYDGQKVLHISKRLSRAEIRDYLLVNKIMFTISPALFPRPEYWPKNAQVVGYHERSKEVQWTPDTSVQNFLSIHDKVIFLTFGSMVNSNPEEISTQLYRVLDELKIPTIVNTASGGLLELNAFKKNENFLFVRNIPYEWILKKVYAVIHHGGSGTTQSALKNGCPTLILPHIIDQFAWNRLIDKLELGPKGISINKVTISKLRGLIDDLYNTEEYKRNAQKLGQSLSKEELEEKLLEFVTENENDQSNL